MFKVVYFLTIQSNCERRREYEPENKRQPIGAESFVFDQHPGIQFAGCCVGPRSSPLPDGCFPGGLPDSVNPEHIILTCLPVPPVEFNGVLLIYAHGYVKPQKPLALPFGELEEFLPLIGTLQLQGFAFGTTSYSVNGLAVEQAESDLNALVNHFKSLLPAGAVKKVLLVGASEGGLITTMMVEKHPDIYAGGLAMCGPLAGLPYQVKYLGDFRVVFDYFFPGVIPLDGIYDDTALTLEEWEMAGGIEENITNAVNENPLLAAQLANITRAAFNPSNQGESAADILSFTVLGMNDAVEKAGGQPYGNWFRWYRGSEDDRALNAYVERVWSDREARQYIRRFYRTTGKLDRPLVTLSNQ